MCKKCNYILPLFLILIIGILCGYIFTLKDNQKCVDDNNKKNVYTYNDISGYYSFKDTNPNNDGREELSTFGYYLYLSENGTFKYQYVMNTGSSIIGNYIIVDDEIRLNYLFNGGSDAAVSATNGEKVLKITDKNTLVDNEAHFSSQGGSETISLTRDSSSYSKNEYDINYIINNYGLFNKENLNY